VSKKGHRHPVGNKKSRKEVTKVGQQRERDVPVYRRKKNIASILLGKRLRGNTAGEIIAEQRGDWGPPHPSKGVLTTRNETVARIGD